MKVLGRAVLKYVLPGAIVLLLLAINGSFMTIRVDRSASLPEPCGLEQAYNTNAVIYDSIAPACVPGETGGAGYTSSSTVVTVVGGTISSSLIDLVLPADPIPGLRQCT
ncbi:MAG: hypothetical protein A2Z02_07100 [Chloroflexi bacterium RBG_16_48_7]|nr:MAG: hypothetical protein A2Z02_07100 [Chloroflexi bacterium RBG_16_48_7]